MTTPATYLTRPLRSERKAHLEALTDIARHLEHCGHLKRNHAIAAEAAKGDRLVDLASAVRYLRDVADGAPRKGWRHAGYLARAREAMAVTERRAAIAWALERVGE